LARLLQEAGAGVLEEDPQTVPAAALAVVVRGLQAAVELVPQDKAIAAEEQAVMAYMVKVAAVAARGVAVRLATLQTTLAVLVVRVGQTTGKAAASLTRVAVALMLGARALARLTQAVVATKEPQVKTVS
jgi:hypothetical protein